MKKIIIKICKSTKIDKVEIENNPLNIETVKEVIDNYNKGDRYYIKNGDEVKPVDNDKYIRSHKNDTSNDNLENLPLSDKCKK